LAGWEFVRGGREILCGIMSQGWGVIHLGGWDFIRSVVGCPQPVVRGQPGMDESREPSM